MSKLNQSNRLVVARGRGEEGTETAECMRFTLGLGLFWREANGEIIDQDRHCKRPAMSKTSRNDYYLDCKDLPLTNKRKIANSGEKSASRV